MASDAFSMLNAIAPFYNFGRGFITEVFSDELDEDMAAQLEPLKSLGSLTYKDDERWVLSIESGKKFHKTGEEKTKYMLSITANKTHFDNVDRIVIEESTDPDAELKGAVVEWKRGNNDLVPTHSVSVMDVLRLSRSIGIDDRRGPEKYELVSHSKKKLVLKIFVDNFST